LAIEALRDHSSRIRAEALEALGGVIERSLASDALPKAFDKRSSKLRVQAFEALSGIDPSLVNEILPLARDEDKDVRLQAIKVLAHLMTDGCSAN